MGRPKQDPVKDVARRILALTTDQRNALHVALDIYEEAMSGGAPKQATTPRRKAAAKPKPALEPSNG